MIPLLIVIFGVFAMGMSLLGEKFKSIAQEHSRLLAFKSLSVTNGSANDPAWESAITSAKDVIQTTQQLEPMSVLGIVELDGCDACVTTRPPSLHRCTRHPRPPIPKGSTTGVVLMCCTLFVACTRQMAKALAFFMIVDLGLVFSRVDWSA